MSVGEDGGAQPATGQPELAEQEPIAVESMCPRCEKNGLTRLLMLDIPHFREIVLMVKQSSEHFHGSTLSLFFFFIYFLFSFF